MNERARLGLEAGAAKAASGRRAMLDPDREREVLLRVAMANPGPLPQADLLAIYRRLITATRRLEVAERRQARAQAGTATGPSSADGPVGHRPVASRPVGGGPAAGGAQTAGSVLGDDRRPG